MVQEPPQVIGKRLGRGVAIGRVFLQCFQDNRFQLGRDSGVEAAESFRFLEGDAAE